MDFDSDPDEYVQPDGPEARQFANGAKIVYCKLCAAALMVPVQEYLEFCGGHEPWRRAFSTN